MKISLMAFNGRRVLMRKVIFIVVCGFIALVLSSCFVNQRQFKSSDKKVVFVPSDIASLDLSAYKITKLKNGKDYFFNTIQGPTGLTIGYSENYLGKNGITIRIITTIILYNKEKDAIKMLDISKNSTRLFGAKKLRNINADEYHADKGFSFESSDRLIITLQKKKLFYQIDIDGLRVSENQVKDELIKKIDNITAIGFEKHKVE
jgi:uncharacterized membrane protein